jgi:hypothetical protein
LIVPVERSGRPRSGRSRARGALQDPPWTIQGLGAGLIRPVRSAPRWLSGRGAGVGCAAGDREREAPGIGDRVERFLEAAGGRLAGADLLRDWSPVRLGTRLARAFHRLDHPSPKLDPVEADGRNLRANAALLSALLGRAGVSLPPGPPAV